MAQAKVYTNKEIVFLLRDAIARTKATPGKEIDNLKPLLSAYYWEFNHADLKEYAFFLIEALNKTQLATATETSKSLTKEQLVELIKAQAKTKTRAWVKNELIPSMEVQINSFESIFGISTANRRRLQEMEGVLPITRWGTYKRGDYPVLGMREVLAIIKAMPEILEKIKNYADEHLSRQAKAIADEKARQLACQEKYETMAAEVSEEIITPYIKELATKQLYKDAINQIQYELRKAQQFAKDRERAAQEQAIQRSFKTDYQKAIAALASEHQHIIQTVAINKLVERERFRDAIGEMNRLVKKQEEADRKAARNAEAARSQAEKLAAHQAVVQRFLSWLNSGDVQLFVLDGGVISFCSFILNDKEVHELCTTILKSHNLGSIGQKRWKCNYQEGKTIAETVEELEDCIFAHPMFFNEGEDFSFNEHLSPTFHSKFKIQNSKLRTQ
ncbi:MAG: hypothetical protein DSM106950_22045 [Stigonema ocellatum SAG 48.90 = DSM 106950]|nr:hypothetical protein [Stigonema ocellatum SAG 48.90 = DSM 106950]